MYETFRSIYRFRENVAEKRMTIRASVLQTSRNKERKKLVSFIWTIIFHEAFFIRLVIPGFMYKHVCLVLGHYKRVLSL